MRNIPFPQMLKIMITASAISARIQLVDALFTADGARERPIQMMIGPVTTGGRKRITFFTPTTLITSARIRYKAPATTIPPQAYGSFSPMVMSAKIPVFNCAIVENPPKNAKDEPKNAGTFNLVQRWKNKVPRPAQIKVTCTERPSPSK